jgi:UDP-N-acetylmuramoylalanine--D-glutamate ligase
MKVLVVGLGKSGAAAVKYLVGRGDAVYAVDKNKETFFDAPIHFQTEDEAIDLHGFDLIVASPGIPMTHAVLAQAKKLGIEIVVEAELAARLIDQRVIGVTGTNGKTTVTMMIAHCLSHAGLNAHALGNIGRPLIGEIGLKGIYVVELSSYQLDGMTTPFLDAALLLNITPDHLDRYGTMENYAASKFHIQDLLKPDGIFVVEEKAGRDYGSLKKKEALIYESMSSHDEENKQAAWMVCQKFGVSRDAFEEALVTFKKPSHRIEFVRTLNGIHFYDDSKGTNIDAALRAVGSLSGNIVLIAGGVDKGFPYTSWREPFQKKVKGIMAIGEAAPNIENDLKGSVPVKKLKTLEEAVKEAYESAEPGDNVLLSPGCSSFDMFKDYADRGQKFQRLVRSLS